MKHALAFVAALTLFCGCMVMHGTYRDPGPYAGRDADEQRVVEAARTLLDTQAWPEWNQADQELWQRLTGLMRWDEQVFHRITPGILERHDKALHRRWVATYGPGTGDAAPAPATGGAAIQD